MRKIVLFCRSNWHAIILVLTTLSVSPSIQGAPPGNATTPPDKTAKHADLVAKYGMTQKQLQQYDALEAVRLKKVAEIKEAPSLLSQERRTRIREAVQEFQSSLGKVLTPQQLALMKGEWDKEADQALKIYAIKKEYRIERSVLKSQETTLSNPAEALTQLNKKYESRLSAVLGQDKAHKIIEQLAREQNFDRRMTTHYGFSDQQLKQYKAIHNQQAIEKFKIRKGRGSNEEKQAKIEQLKAQTEQKLDQILTTQQRSAMAAQKQKTNDGERLKAVKARKKKVQQQ